MLNAKKLLYILADVAYIAELMPSKKEHTFTIQSFRQVNGEFMTEDEFINDNIQKLFEKIDAEEYHLVLPDFLFTNTIIEVQDTVEAKVKAYVKDELLPKLEVSKDTHEVETFVLTQHQGKSKVQLSAIEKSVLEPIAQHAKDKGVHITGVSPLSWTIKSVVSLEPSISVLQMGATLYVAQHYIGIDQATSARVDEVENVAETIKTLKGAEPSILTVYLLTNELVEDTLKQQISNTLPIQQLASFKEDETQMPSYVKQIIESGMKTLDIEEYKVPIFSLPKPSGNPINSAKPVTSEPEEVSTQPALSAKTDLEESAAPMTDLPKPTTLTNPTSTLDKEEVAEKEEKTETPALPAPDLPALAAPATAAVTSAAAVISVTEAVTATTVSAAPNLAINPKPELAENKPASEPEKTTDLVVSSEPETKTEPTAITPTVAETSSVNSSSLVTPEAKTVSSTPDLSQFAPATAVITPEPPTVTPTVVTPATAAVVSPVTPPTAATTTIIKPKSEINGMLRMVFVTIAAFAITVAVGVGIGLGVLSLNKDKGKETISPVATPPATSPTPAVSPSPSASPVATSSADKTTKTEKILVVNATSIAGYAGKTKKNLETAGYKGVVASNAKGDYQPGTYVLLPSKDEALVSTLTKDSQLELTYQDGFATEDPKGEYDAVIVLAK